MAWTSRIRPASSSSKRSSVRGAWRRTGRSSVISAAGRPFTRRTSMLRAGTTPVERGPQVEARDPGAAGHRSRQRGVLAGGVRHRMDRLGEQRFEPARVLGEQAAEQPIERAAVPRQQLRRRDAAALVVLLERTPGAQMEHADVALGGADQAGGLERGVSEHVAQQQHRALARAERFEREQKGVGDALGEAVARLGARLLAGLRVEPSAPKSRRARAARGPGTPAAAGGAARRSRGCRRPAGARARDPRSASSGGWATSRAKASWTMSSASSALPVIR